MISRSIYLAALVSYGALAAAPASAARTKTSPLSPLRDRSASLFRQLEESLLSQDRSAAAARSKALHKNVLGLTALAAAEGGAKRFSPACARDMESASWSLAQMAESAAFPELTAQARTVWAASEACGLGPSEAALSSLKDLDWAVGAAESLVADLEAAAGRTASCSEGFSVDGLVADLRAGKYSSREVDLLKKGTGMEILHYYQHRHYSEGAPALCAKTAAAESLFLRKTEADARCGTFGCAQWHQEASFSQAILTRSPELPKICAGYVAQSRSGMSAGDAAAVCGIISKNLGDARALCSSLVPRYLSAGKLESCVGEFSRFQVYDDERACASLESWPGEFLERCRGDAKFTRAFRAKDPSLCGDNERCWLYMGAWPEKFAAKYQDRIRDSLCSALSQAARQDLDAARALVARSADALAGSRSDAGELLPRRRRLAALEERLGRVRLTQTVSAPLEAYTSND